MVPAKLFDKIAKDFDLSKEELIDESLKAELRRRLAAHRYIDYILSRKYKMSFVEFERKKIIAKRKYSLEVEEDYHNWDQAVDGAKTIAKDLKLLGCH
ncbi:MAG: hypothetical protein QME05_02430 [Candidatus Margulisbacteria bacterium]|nr:hypothetical protein [Candidatus Margulisiibacteriota bacterium]